MIYDRHITYKGIIILHRKRNITTTCNMITRFFKAIGGKLQWSHQDLKDLAKKQAFGPNFKAAMRVAESLRLMDLNETGHPIPRSISVRREGMVFVRNPKRIARIFDGPWSKNERKVSILLIEIFAIILGSLSPWWVLPLSIFFAISTTLLLFRYEREDILDKELWIHPFIISRKKQESSEISALSLLIY